MLSTDHWNIDGPPFPVKCGRKFRFALGGEVAYRCVCARAGVWIKECEPCISFLILWYEVLADKKNLTAPFTHLLLELGIVTISSHLVGSCWWWLHCSNSPHRWLPVLLDIGTLQRQHFLLLWEWIWIQWKEEYAASLLRCLAANKLSVLNSTINPGTRIARLFNVNQNKRAC